MKYGYIRVSTRGQASEGNGLEAQREALKVAGAEKLFEDVMTGRGVEGSVWRRDHGNEAGSICSKCWASVRAHREAP